MKKQFKKLVIGGKTFKSRLIIGTGKFTNFQTNKKALEASGANIITVAMRRVNIENNKSANPYIKLNSSDIFAFKISGI